LSRLFCSGFILRGIGLGNGASSVAVVVQGLRDYREEGRKNEIIATLILVFVWGLGLGMGTYRSIFSDLRYDVAIRLDLQSW
jgi:hypothetical protein